MERSGGGEEEEGAGWLGWNYCADRQTRHTDRHSLQEYLVEHSARLGNLNLVEVRENIIIGVEGQPT